MSLYVSLLCMCLYVSVCEPVCVSVCEPVCEPIVYVPVCECM